MKVATSFSRSSRYKRIRSLCACPAPSKCVGAFSLRQTMWYSGGNEECTPYYYCARNHREGDTRCSCLLASLHLGCPRAGGAGCGCHCIGEHGATQDVEKPEGKSN